MNNTGTKRRVQSAEDFWGGKEALVDAFDRGEDAVAKAITFYKQPEERVVES